MPTATLTSKGQTTIPKAIRSYLHLRVGDRIEFIVDENGRVVLRPATRDVAELEGMLPRPKRPVSLAEMEQAIRERAGRER
jgi:antitoxin PrlF